ncbi:MAG: acyl-CoA reductase [Chitinophagaceae bacterium]
MNLHSRIEVLVSLGKYMLDNDEEWLRVKEKAYNENKWFTPEFIELAVKNITANYLKKEHLTALASHYLLPDTNDDPRKIGLVMAGNIPLVGFHDALSVFLTGHYAIVKPSSKDAALVKHLIQKLKELNNEAEPYFEIKDLLQGCDAYIATGSNNTARYFEYYFKKYPHIIRKNRTSVAILSGRETAEDLENLADDVHHYFGLGCRNVTKLYVPDGYDFVPLLEAFRKYQHFNNHNKYKNNYEYRIAVNILNKRYYMTNGTIILTEDASPFSPISQLHYEYYKNAKQLKEKVSNNEAFQCIVGSGTIPFGLAQCPQLTDFADGVDTIKFLKKL